MRNFYYLARNKSTIAPLPASRVFFAERDISLNPLPSWAGYTAVRTKEMPVFLHLKGTFAFSLPSLRIFTDCNLTSSDLFESPFMFSDNHMMDDGGRCGNVPPDAAGPAKQFICQTHGRISFRWCWRCLADRARCFQK